LKIVRSQPLYAMGVVSDLLDVHAETIRAWERSGVVQPPQRRSGKRCYSQMDLKRLEFVHRLTEEGLTLPAIRYHLRLYPCWEVNDCPGSICSSSQSSFAKPCWREAETYCQAPSNENLCADCQLRHQQEQYEEPSISHS